MSTNRPSITLIRSTTRFCTCRTSTQQHPTAPSAAVACSTDLSAVNSCTVSPPPSGSAPLGLSQSIAAQLGHSQHWLQQTLDHTSVDRTAGNSGVNLRNCRQALMTEIRPLPDMDCRSGKWRRGLLYLVQTLCDRLGTLKPTAAVGPVHSVLCYIYLPCSPANV